jgi:formylmethanofuran--tetrahydromethanopterin N-formyltransferase
MLRASAKTDFAPTLRKLVPSELPDGVEWVYEVVIEGLTLEAVGRATVTGFRAADRPEVVEDHG